jgi:hypothetical protein
MKKQNLQNGIFILVISGVFYHTFTLPMKPKIGRGIASVTSRYCDERTGAGLVGSVCYGEDWWLPSSVEENSPYGTVYAYGPNDRGFLETSPNDNTYSYISGVNLNSQNSNLFPDLVEQAVGGTAPTEDQIEKAIGGHLKQAWYPFTEYYCSWVFEPLAQFKSDSPFPWATNLPDNAKRSEGMSQDANGNTATGDSCSYGVAFRFNSEEQRILCDTINQFRSCRKLEAFYPSTIPSNPSVIGNDLYKNDFIKRIAHHGWYIETGDGMSLDSDNQLLTNFTNFMEVTEQTTAVDSYDIVKIKFTNFNGKPLNTIDLFKRSTADDNWDRISEVYKRYGTFLNGGGSTTNGANLLDNFWVIWLNGEAGLWPYYLGDDFVCLSDDTSGVGNCSSNNNLTWTEIAQRHAIATEDSGIDPKRFMININNGGTLFKPFEEIVYSAGFSMGNHGAFGVFNYQFLQHFRHLQYNNLLKAFVSDYDLPKPYMLHTDLESMFGKNSNLWGDYRLFRLSALSALAYRMNSLVTMSNGIIDKDENIVNECYGDERCINFRRQYESGVLDHSGALKMHTWLKKVIGREKTNSVDGWCAPMHMGQDLGGKTLAQAVNEFRVGLDKFDEFGGNDTNGDGYNDQKKSRFIDTHTFQGGTFILEGGTGYRDYSVNSPLKTFVGHHCKMTTQGEPGIKLDPVWTGYEDCLDAFDTYGDAAYNSCMNNDDSSNWILSTVGFSGRALSKTSPVAFNNDSYPYEGRATSSDKKHLVFEFDDYLFKNPNEKNIVVKIVLRPKTIIAGTPRVGKINVAFTHGDRTAVQSKQFAQTDFSSDSRYISTLTLKFARRGGGAAKVRISHDSGGHFDYLMVRVIPTEE